MSIKKQQNVFVTLLKLLNVKHTNDFSNKYFNEHPHKYNLFGISKMLSDYGIENIATKIIDKENDIAIIETPFIAHFGGDFVVVDKIDADKISYFQNGKKNTLLAWQFIRSWSGIILLAETTPQSGEPDYQKHRKKEILSIVQNIMLVLVSILLLVMAYFSNKLFRNPGVSFLLIINLIGVYIGFLLVVKQMHSHSQLADKICSLLSQNGCNNVLESNASKLWGMIGWSEIGLGYFVANILLLLFFPQKLFILAIINCFTLPYSFWSIWYQKMKVRQWCPLCLIVQFLLWGIFTINCIFGYFCARGIDSTVLTDILFAGCVYAGCILGFNLLIPKLEKGEQTEQTQQEINSIKANEIIFRTLLTKQPYYEVNNADSQIILGNSDAQLVISILTNPFCNPCAKMHKQIEKFLRDTNRKACVQYLFSSFNSNLEFANKYLIATYLEKEQIEFERIISKWFEKGKLLKEAFFKDLHLNMMNPDIEVEFQKHEAWKIKMHFMFTPIVLVNGYRLPEIYKIDDLIYFTEFNVNIK